MTFVVTRQRAQEVHALARARAGLPYAYGGAFTRDPSRSTDCSGLVMQTAAWYGGRSDWPGQRYGSTESFRLDQKIVYDLGFKRMPPGGPAALPFKPVMLVGLMHGGGGENSHTACTLMTMDIPGGPVVQSVRGVDWESHGGNPGVSLYDGARAWNDSLFHDFWYLDAKLEDALATPGEMTVPLAQRANGAWGSPSPAWDHLIMRESSGNPTIIQQIIDVNSGGNEAEGLFQITPKTWRAHNGTEFAPSARFATPQQQAIVAARIFTRNPSGSDWGAGLSGREDARQLAAGLVPTQPQGDDDFMSALTDDEQREVLSLLRVLAKNPYPSRSPLRHLGEGPIDTVAGIGLNEDGNVHVVSVIELARVGDYRSLSLLAEVAGADPVKYPDRQQDALLARRILADLEANYPASLQAFVQSQNGVQA